MSKKNPDLSERLAQLLHYSMARYHVTLATVVAPYLANATIVGRRWVYPFAFVVVYRAIWQRTFTMLDLYHRRTLVPCCIQASPFAEEL